MTTLTVFDVQDGVKADDVLFGYLPASSAARSARTAVTGSNYEVVVKGRLSPALIASVDGFAAIRSDDGSTHLVGWISDQSRLHGVLGILRDLNIELISINQAP
jgi:hypothetical protein